MQRENEHGPRFQNAPRIGDKSTSTWWRCNDCRTEFCRAAGVQPETCPNERCNDNANRRRWADLLQQNEELEQRLEKVEAWIQQQETHRQEQNEWR